jgi:hypothetical protein
MKWELIASNKYDRIYNTLVLKAFERGVLGEKLFPKSFLPKKQKKA